MGRFLGLWNDRRAIQRQTNHPLEFPLLQTVITHAILALPLPHLEYQETHSSTYHSSLPINLTEDHGTAFPFFQLGFISIRRRATSFSPLKRTGLQDATPSDSSVQKPKFRPILGSKLFLSTHQHE
jgi:hypothetical protein